MSDGITTRIEGLADLKLAVEALKQDMRKRVVRGALRDAARPIVNRAKQRAPVLKTPSRYRTPGLLKRSIKVFSSKRYNGRDGTLGVFVAVRASKAKLRASGGRGAKNPNDPFYWFWQEFGFTAVGRRRVGGGRFTRPGRLEARVKGGSARRIPGLRFMRDGFEGGKGEALSVFQARIKTRIDQANQRKP
ncbi:MAG TPA: HK97-gp10 family putative phage morphogenesis protein [Burkholderiales bacterium]|nr:HK97-gp10 family putative phage morphogenesis protein [Burkholderiales bacterium]